MNATERAQRIQEIEAKEQALEPVVKRAIARVREAVAAQKPALKEAFHYGATGIDPKHLVIWYIFLTDRDKATAQQNGLIPQLERLSREALRTEGYPVEALGLMHVGFASDEEIWRAGGFRQFFA